MLWWSVGAAAVYAQVPATPTPVARGGFGDRANSYAWSMAWFKGRLYVGTARHAMCVEAATIDFYWAGTGFYSTNPAPGVTCPPRIEDADLRAEVWRYDPAAGRWSLVHRSPRVRLPNGRRVARDIGYRGMVVRRGALYVGALSADEFLPQLRRRSPPRILRTTDGRRFRALGGRPGIIRTPYGPRRPVGFRAMTVHRGALHVTASGGLTGDGVVLRVDRPASRSPRYEQVSPRHLSVFELAEFGGVLYAGTGSAADGYGVWRTDGRTWTPVLTGGAGRGSAMTSVVSMAPYRGHLYVGASGWGTPGHPQSELVRIGRDDGWDVVVGAAREDDGGTRRTPLSGQPDGFGNAFNSHFWRMQAYRGTLLLGTNDWSGSLREDPAAARTLAEGFGFDLYGTCDGRTWFTLTEDAFGRPQDFGLRTMAATRAGLFVGTTNHVQGTTVYRWRASFCGSRPRAATRPATARVLARRHLHPCPARGRLGLGADLPPLGACGSRTRKETG